MASDNDVFIDILIREYESAGHGEHAQGVRQLVSDWFAVPSVEDMMKGLGRRLARSKIKDVDIDLMDYFKSADGEDDIDVLYRFMRDVAWGSKLSAYWIRRDLNLGEDFKVSLTANWDMTLTSSMFPGAVFYCGMKYVLIEQEGKEDKVISFYDDAALQGWRDAFMAEMKNER